MCWLEREGEIVRRQMGIARGLLVVCAGFDTVSMTHLKIIEKCCFCFVFLSTSMHLLWLLLSISHSQYSVSIQYSTIKHFIFVLKAFPPRSSPHQINVENRIRNCFIMLFYPKASIEHTFCLHLYLTLFWYDYHCFFSFTEVYTILKFDKTIAILFLEIINELRFKLIPFI